MSVTMSVTVSITVSTCVCVVNIKTCHASVSEPLNLIDDTIPAVASFIFWHCGLFTDNRFCLSGGDCTGNSYGAGTVLLIS